MSLPNALDDAIPLPILVGAAPWALSGRNTAYVGVAIVRSSLGPRVL
jgi:hypothetical protein